MARINAQLETGVVKIYDGVACDQWRFTQPGDHPVVPWTIGWDVLVESIGPNLDLGSILVSSEVLMEEIIKWIHN